MDKVLPGSSRAAFTFVIEHWQGLLKISILPILIVTAISWYQIQGMGVMFEFIAAQDKLGGQMDAETLSKFMSSMTKFYAFGLLSVLVFTWLFVRIVRFWKNGIGEAFGVTQGELGSTFMTIVFGLGMMLLSLVVYFAGAIVVAIAASIGSLPFFVALFATVFGLIVFMYRFLVGLPGIALGEVPGFFADIWPLAKGESFGLPLRMILWTIAAFIPIMILSYMFSFPMMADIQEQLKTQSPPQLTPDMMRRVFNTMAPLQIVNVMIQMPLIWFATILLTEAHFRFRKKLSG